MVQGFVIDKLRELEKANALVKEVRANNPYRIGEEVEYTLGGKTFTGIIMKFMKNGCVLRGGNFFTVIAPLSVLKTPKKPSLGEKI